MPRARKSSSARSKTRSRKTKATSTTRRAGSTGTTATETFTCPECGRTFSRAAALGAHRRRAHGVAGQSTAARRSRGGRRGAATSRGTRGASRNGASGAGANRDQLLRSLFPAGVPPREDVIRAVNSWLDEADRLARLR